MANGLPKGGGLDGSRASSGAGPAGVAGSCTCPLGGPEAWEAYHWSSREEARALVSALRAAVELSGPRALVAADELDRVISAPVRVEVKGREGVGKTRTLQALAFSSAGELLFAETGLEASHDPPEIVVHVLVSAARGEDKEASSAVDSTMACGVLNKCDTVSTPGDSRLWSQAGEAAERSAKELGYPVFPAAALLADAEVDASMYSWIQVLARSEEPVPPSADLFLEAGRGSPVGMAERGRLVREIGMHGLCCACSALQSQGSWDPGRLTGYLRGLSGFGPFLGYLQRLVVRARARRISEFLAKMAQAADLGVLREEIEAILAGPAAARLRMDAAARGGVLDLGPEDPVFGVDLAADPASALQEAVRFRALGARCSDPRAAGLAWDLHVGFLRFWAERSHMGRPA